ncbi:WxL domain-containing protein [Carnobacterium maltaromaticum]|uniref:WxL domain-containing protein n=1 Tax=Carnobacterium maltaromaticum TaxID=2751 RepID=UPI00026C8E00|nr:WxL domain-containing protein [Carnobacterium maltaromaticum]
MIPIQKFILIMGVGLLVLPTLSVQADDTTSSETLPPQNNTSKSSVGLTPGEPTEPHELLLDIWHPTKHIGSLTIDAVTGFKFSEITLSSYGKEVYAIVARDEVNGETPPIDTGLLDRGYTLAAQVTDVRGTGAGWTLTASISDFSDGEKKLKGAIFSFPVSAVYSDRFSEEEEAAPISKEAVFDTSNVELPILVAEPDTGLGSWIIFFDTDDRGISYPWLMDKNGNFHRYGGPSLYVPSGNLAGNYVAAITWSLRDAP